MKRVYTGALALLSPLSVFALDLHPKGAPSPFSLESFLPLIIILAALYFIMIRPQMRKSKEHRQLLSNLSKGDEVVTAGGVLGKVSSVTDHFVDMIISDSVTIRVQKQSVLSLVPKGSIEVKSTQGAKSGQSSSKSK